MNKKINILIISILLFASAIIFWLSFARKSEKQNSPAIPAESAPSSGTTDNPQIFFASNGKNTVYKIKKGDKWSVIWNGKEGKDYDFVSNPVFSSDGSQLAYNAEIDGQAYVVVNNTQEINAYQKASYLVFSENGKVIAFAAAKSDGTYVVITSTLGEDSPAKVTESETINQIGTVVTADGKTTAVILSSDGSQVAYVIQNGDRISIVVNGQTGNSYDSITNFSFNEDGTYSYTAQNGNQTVTVVNNNVVSTVPAPNTNNTSANNPPSPNINPPSSNNSTLENYKYKISTQKDIRLDPDRLDYSPCPAGSDGCNF